MQLVNAFRARSARVFRTTSLPEKSDARISSKVPETYSRSVSFVDDPSNRRRLLKRRVMSEPSRSVGCQTCTRAQDVIDVYEIEMEKDKNFKAINHSICLFNDRQMETFMHLLETEYCAKMPNVTDLLHNSKSLFVSDATKSRISHRGSLHKDSVQRRVKMFCQKQEAFNKRNPTSSSIKNEIEVARRNQATVNRFDMRRMLSA